MGYLSCNSNYPVFWVILTLLFLQCIRTYVDLVALIVWLRRFSYNFFALTINWVEQNISYQRNRKQKIAGAKHLSALISRSHGFWWAPKTKWIWSVYQSQYFSKTIMVVAVYQYYLMITSYTLKLAQICLSEGRPGARACVVSACTKINDMIIIIANNDYAAVMSWETKWEV